MTSSFNFVLFIVLPYVAILLAIGGSIYRYYSDRFTYSSLSSEFLESRSLFWGSVPWHFAIIIILLAHIIAAVIPEVWEGILASPLRLYVLEATGLALAICAIVGLLALIVRRFRFTRVRVVTSPMDWILLFVLLAQVALGFTVALFYRWGADWYLHTAVPWLWSIFQLQPNADSVTALPLLVKLHLIGGFVIIGLIPFTRLVHLFTYPLPYLWRPYQLVIWNRRQRNGRAAVAQARNSR